MFFAFHTLIFTTLVFVSSINSFSVERLLYEEDRNKNRPSFDYEDVSSSEPESNAYGTNQLHSGVFENLTKEKTSDLKSHAFDKMLSEELLSVKKQLDYTTSTHFTLSFSTSTLHTPTVVVRQRWPIIELMAKSIKDNNDKIEKQVKFTETTVKSTHETTDEEESEEHLAENKIFHNDLNEKVIGLRSLNHIKDSDDEIEGVVCLTYPSDVKQNGKNKSHNHKQCTHSSTRCLVTHEQNCTRNQKFCHTKGSAEHKTNHDCNNHQTTIACTCSNYGKHSQDTTPMHQCMHSTKCYTSSPQNQCNNENGATDSNANLYVCSNNCLQHPDSVKVDKMLPLCPPCPTIENIQYAPGIPNLNSLSTLNPPTFYPLVGYQPGISYPYYYLMQASTFTPYAYPDVVTKPKHKRKHKTTTPEHHTLYNDDDSSDEYESDYLENDYGNRDDKKPDLDRKLDVEIKFDVEDIKENEAKKNKENCEPYHRRENEFVNEIANDLKVYYSDAVIKDCYCSSSSKGIISQIIIISFYCLCIHTMPLLLFAL